MPKLSPISTRFLQVLADHTGPGKKYRFKNKFAKAIGMIPQELTKIEKGADLQVRHMIALRKLIGTDLNWLLTGEEKDMPEASTVLKRLERLEKELQGR